MKKLFFLSIIAIILLVNLAACQPALSTSVVSIRVPETGCKLNPGQKIPISLDGTIPKDATVRWEASRGTLHPTDTLATNYQAPDEIGPTVITAWITITGTNYSFSSVLDCSVIVLTPQAPTETSTLGATITPTASPTQEPTGTWTPGVTATITLTPTFTLTATASLTPTLAITDTPSPSPTFTWTPLPPTDFSIAITEVMSNPCGNVADHQANQYIEFYNYGDVPIDVKGWYFMATNNKGNPDQMVPWSARYPHDNLPGDVILDTTVIQPKSYAILLAPFYESKNNPHHMPYTFRKGTVILTIPKGDWLGNKIGGLVGERSGGYFRDRVFIYIPMKTPGKELWVGKLVSTYGLKRAGDEPHTFYELEGLPITTYQCQSAQRRNASHADIPDNWEVNKTPDPGSGPYDEAH